jgi:hypothetical protein
VSTNRETVPYAKTGRPRKPNALWRIDEAAYKRAQRAAKRAQKALEGLPLPQDDVCPLSQEEQDSEWAKCEADVEYFFKTYVRIVNADGELIDFPPYAWQLQFIEAFKTQRRVIGLCARQSGKSTATVCLALHHVLFSGWKTCAITANKGLTSQELILRARRAYGLLPLWMQRRVSLVTDNMMALGFSNGSRIFGAATSPTSISGQSVTLLIVDETAKIENWPVFWPSTSQTISQSRVAKIVMLSTPFGHNHFKDFVDGAPVNGWHLIAVPWWDVPGRDEAWRERTIREDFNGDAEMFAAEHELSFASSGGLLINGRTLTQIKGNLREPILCPL